MSSSMSGDPTLCAEASLVMGPGFRDGVAGEQAVTAASGQCPDLITADVHLATGSGISAVRRICERRPVPVVFVTGNPEELHVPAAIVVSKPFTETELARAVAAAIDG